MLSDKLRSLARICATRPLTRTEQSELARHLRIVADDCAQWERSTCATTDGVGGTSIDIDDVVQIARDILMRRRYPSQDSARLLAVSVLALCDALKGQGAS